MIEGGVSPIPREARPFQGRRAGLVTRSLANAIDALVVGALLALGYLALNGLLFVLNPRSFEFRAADLLLSLTAALALLVLYLTAAWAATGRTYGCHVMGLRVVSRRGKRLGLPLAFVRAVACAFFPIGLGWCAVNREQRSIQDVVLRTSVIYDWSPRAQVSADRS